MGKRVATALLIAAACAAGVFASFAAATLSGPAKIRPGTQVSFGVTGLPKKAKLTVKLTTAGGGGVILGQHPTSNGSGRATVAFKVPRKYNVQISCNAVYNECQTKRWKDGQKAKLKVCPKGGACQSKALRIKKP